MGCSFWETLGGFLIHNIPTFFLLAALILGWRWEWAGAAGFIAFAIWYLIFFRGLEVGIYLALAGVSTLIGLLFLVGWLFRRQIRG
jgi:hypothetical protein